ncbi:hypothetical protein Btru_021876 [Bulinus truncatus]|nr:hypothetical protein Btru_021876 [Bulinus truncatus]
MGNKLRKLRDSLINSASHEEEPGTVSESGHYRTLEQSDPNDQRMSQNRPADQSNCQPASTDHTENSPSSGQEQLPTLAIEGSSTLNEDDVNDKTASSQDSTIEPVTDDHPTDRLVRYDLNCDINTELRLEL